MFLSRELCKLQLATGSDRYQREHQIGTSHSKGLWTWFPGLIGGYSGSG